MALNGVQVCFQCNRELKTYSCDRNLWPLLMNQDSMLKLIINFNLSLIHSNERARHDAHLRRESCIQKRNGAKHNVINNKAIVYPIVIATTSAFMICSY